VTDDNEMYSVPTYEQIFIDVRRRGTRTTNDNSY